MSASATQPSNNNEDDEDSKASKMRVARLFESTSSVNDILKEELFKSVVSNELNSLNSMGVTEILSDVKPPSMPSSSQVLNTRSSSSSAGGSNFLESMLATLSSKQGKKKESSSQTKNGSTAAETPMAPPATVSTKNRPAVKGIEDLTSSKNWNNLGSHEAINDLNVTEVFKTQQDNETATASAMKKRKKGKTNWDAIMKQGLEAATAMAAAAPPAALPPVAIPQIAPAILPAVKADTMLPPAPVIKAEEIPSAPTNEPVPVEVGSTKNEAKNGKKRARADKQESTRPPPKPSSRKSAGNSSKGRKYFEPTDNDVLLGRGYVSDSILLLSFHIAARIFQLIAFVSFYRGRANNHPGNKRYLELKDTIQDRYMAADKNQKTEISQELVDIVNKEWKGHFLKLDPDTNQWYEVDNITARKKCSQTLREINTAEVRAAKRARYRK